MLTSGESMSSKGPDICDFLIPTFFLEPAVLDSLCKPSPLSYCSGVLVESTRRLPSQAKQGHTTQFRDVQHHACTQPCRGGVSSVLRHVHTQPCRGGVTQLCRGEATSVLHHVHTQPCRGGVSSVLHHVHTQPYRGEVTQPCRGGATYQ